MANARKTRSGIVLRLTGDEIFRKPGSAERLVRDGELVAGRQRDAGEEALLGVAGAFAGHPSYEESVSAQAWSRCKSGTHERSTRRLRRRAAGLVFPRNEGSGRRSGSYAPPKTQRRFPADCT